MAERSARLYCKVGTLAGSSFSFQEELVVGRNPDCSATLDPIQMSGRHARIFFDAEQGRYFLEDLDSLNGTALDGEAVHGTEPLGHLNVVTFARRFDFVFQDLHRCAHRHDGVTAPLPDADDVEKTRIEALPLPIPSILDRLGSAASLEGMAAFETTDAAVEKTNYQKIVPRLPSNLAGLGSGPETASQEISKEAPVVAMGSVSRGMPSVEERSSQFDLTDERPEGFWLMVFLEDGQEQSFPLHQGDNLVGREVSADVRPASQEISRRHARLIVEDDRVQLEDLGSRNRTFLLDQKIEGIVEVPLAAEIRFGRVVARVIHIGSSST